MILLLLALSLGALSQKAVDQFELDSFSWRAEATPQAAIIAANDWGDLRVRTTDRRGLVVSAMIQNMRAQKEFDIRIDERREQVIVTVRPLVTRPRGRVDLTLMIPAGKRVNATTRGGLAEIKYSGDVETRTRTGVIAVETPASASARTETGSITAKLTGDLRQQPLSFTSRSGDITVWLAENASVDLRASTRGAIELGFPDKASGGGRPRSRVERRIGMGGAQLRIQSASGNIKVLPYAVHRPSR